MLVDKDTKEAMIQTTIQLLKSDSTFVTGALSSESGTFSLTAPSNGKYIIKISSVGYNNLYKDIEVKHSSDVALGQIEMKSEAIMLKGAQIVAQAAKVVVKADTFEYNAAAYRTPEGSVVEELVKKLPGAQVDDDGKITINGKEVKKILVDGKEFMTGDTQTAMKNLPTSMIDRIKAYDQKSDLARVSGIDDGEEETVLDFGIKRGMNKGMFGNIDLSGGTENRYAERIMGSWFSDNNRLMFFGNFNNTNDMGFPGGGGGGRWGNRSGLTKKNMIGLNYNYEKKDKLKIDLSGRWNNSDTDNDRVTATEDFGDTPAPFSNSRTLSNSIQNTFNLRGRLEWTPDTMLTIMFRPYASISRQKGWTNSSSVSYSENPYELLSDPYDVNEAEKVARQLLYNSSRSYRTNLDNNTNIGARAEMNWKLNSRGRNLTLTENASYTDGKTEDTSISQIIKYLVEDEQNINRFSETPTNNWNSSTKLTYTEPLAHKLYLQFGYQFQYRYSKNDKNTFDIDEFDAAVKNEKLSTFSEYKNYIHDFELMLRFVRDSYKLNAGVMFQPQTSRLNYRGFGKDESVSRSVQNITPTLDFRFTPNKVTQLRLEYRGSTSQPSMTNLLEITDDSDPLNIRTGNAGLKPSFTNNLRAHFNTYLENHMQSMMSFFNYSTTRNAISNMVSYDQQTAVKTTRPENINGNWNLNWGGMYNASIDSAGVWNVNIFTMVAYNNYVGYQYNRETLASVKNTTKSTMVMPRLQASYRKDWLEITADGNFTYNHSVNELQPMSNLDTWQFAYGGSLNIFAPWGTSLSTDLHNQNRRGYSDSSMNTNELIWNAQISQSFLKGRPLTVSLQFYDILRQQNSYSRSISAMQRVDTEDRIAINSYGMLKLTYRFNFFGGKKAREKMENQFMGPPGMPTRGMGGRRPMGGPRW